MVSAKGAICLLLLLYDNKAVAFYTHALKTYPFVRKLARFQVMIFACKECKQIETNDLLCTSTLVVLANYSVFYKTNCKENNKKYLIHSQK